MTSREQWISCRVYDGMFSDECAVELDAGSQVMTVYVSRDVVQGEGEEGRRFALPTMPICQLVVEEVVGQPFRNDSQFQKQSRPTGS